MDQNRPGIKHKTPQQPIELWVDWEPYVDHGMADRREGNAWVREGALFVAGGEEARRFEGLSEEVLADINRLGGLIVAANVYGPVSY